MKYKVRDGFVVKINEGMDDEKRFKDGDVVEMTLHEFQSHQHKVEPVEAAPKK